MKIILTISVILVSSTMELTMTLGNQTISQNSGLNSSFADSIKSSIKNSIISNFNANSNPFVQSQPSFSPTALTQAGFGYVPQAPVQNHVHAYAPSTIIQPQAQVNQHYHALPSGSVSYNPYGYYYHNCLLYTSPSPRDATLSRMPSSA